MQKATEQPTTTPEATDGLVAAALRAEAWAGEAFLHPDEDPTEALAAGTARRRALDDALAEIEAGRRAPSSTWKVRYGLMLGLERVLSERSPRLASGTELRRHQIDALAGMLTELIAAVQEDEGPLNGNGVDEEEDDEPDETSEEDVLEELPPENDRPDPGAARRYRFRHPTASGKTIAAAGFVEAARSLGVLILTHRRLLVSQFQRDLRHEGYGERFTGPVERGSEPPVRNPLTIQTYAWFARHVGDLSRTAYQLVICDEAHTALGEKTSAAIRSFPEPIYIGMTATEQLIAKQVSDVFPASVDDLPLGDAARRGLIAPLRCLRVPPAAAINTVPIVGGDFDGRALAAALDHQALNQAAASLYRDRFDDTPGIVYAAGVDHAYNLAQEFRATGIKAEAVSGRTPPVRLAETLAAYERGEINVLINAQLLAEGWNSPRATVCMHLAPTASKRVYQQRIGRIMRMHPRKEAGIVVDFVPKGATHNERVVSLHSLLDADFYREGARVTPAPRRRMQRRARRKLTPAPWLVPVTPDVARRLAVIQRGWQRAAGIRLLLRAIAESKPDAPDQILARWTWRLARAVRKTLDRKASQEYPDAKRLLGALANSRGHRHEENAGRLVHAALEMPIPVGAALVASADSYTPRATQLLDAARERLGTIHEIAGALADDLPAPKTGPSRSRRRRRKKKQQVTPPAEATATQPEEGAAPRPKRRRRRRPAAQAAPAPDAPAADL